MDFFGIRKSNRNGGGTNVQFQPFLNFDNGMLNSGSDFYQTIPPAQSNGNANVVKEIKAA